MLPLLRFTTSNSENTLIRRNPRLLYGRHANKRKYLSSTSLATSDHTTDLYVYVLMAAAVHCIHSAHRAKKAP